MRAEASWSSVLVRGSSCSQSWRQIEPEGLEPEGQSFSDRFQGGFFQTPELKESLHSSQIAGGFDEVNRVRQPVGDVGEADALGLVEDAVTRHDTDVQRHQSRIDLIDSGVVAGCEMVIEIH